MKYSIVRDGETANVTVFTRDETGATQMLVANNDNPNFDAILVALTEGDEDLAVELFDTAKTIAKRFERISDRVSVANGYIYLDGDMVNNALTDQILRFLKEGQDFKPLALFFEKLQSNPNEHSREQLYRWLQTHDFTITDDGDFIGYKSVQIHRESDTFQSVNTGNAIVNGEAVSGHIPNPIGGIIEMPRSEVQHDPSIGCHTGLHVGTWNYVTDHFRSDAILKVKVNPRDVVSVPTDCGDQKIRTCRYTVVESISQPVTAALDTSYDWYDDDEDDEFDDECACSGYNCTCY